MSNTTNVNEMLAGRESRYGSFQGHAEISQVIKQVMHSAAKARNKASQRYATDRVLFWVSEFRFMR